MKNIEFIKFLKQKFGGEIVEAILESGDGLKLKKGHSQDLYYKNFRDQNNTIAHTIIKETAPKYADDVLSQNLSWAFDFPGWIGELDFSSEMVKEIMVIGMEPHIGISESKPEIRNFQATYGLRETADNEFGEIDEYKPNTQLWKNLHGIFGNLESYKSRDFLNRFYITDMAHFAVQGKAKDVLKVKSWPKIREGIAGKFLMKEIEFIQPKYIVSQSTSVANFIERFLEEKGELISKKYAKDFTPKLPEKYVNSPKLKKFSFNGRTIVHIRVPHLASGMTNHFWIPSEKHAENRKARLAGIKSELIHFAQN